MVVQQEEPAVEVIIHRRTPGSGHLTAAMSVQDAVAFADAELALGRAVIVEIGEESLLVRKGREIADFIRKVLGGKTEPTPKVTTITPMAGGAVNQIVPMPLVPMPREAAMQPGMARPSTGAIASPEAELRAWNALIERIGERAAQGMLSGGGYAIRSKLWPHVIYVVSPEIIKIVNQGMQVGRICIVTPNGGSIWDTVLSRIQLLQADEDGEVQVFATGQLMQG